MYLSNITKNKIKESLLQVAPDASIILYGSQARGDADMDSDIDILILLPDALGNEEFVKRKIQISGRLYDLSLELGIEISPLILVPKVFNAYATPFTENIKREGVAL